MKINNFRVDQTDVSAKKEALMILFSGVNNTFLGYFGLIRVFLFQ